MSKSKFIVVRSLQVVVMMWLILSFLFFFFRLMPGSFEDIMMFQGVRPEQIEVFRQKWGLNDPLYVQYYRYIVNFATGDVGMSLRVRQPVWEVVKMRIFNSFILIAPGITLGYIIGSIVGTLIGTNRGSRFERFGVMATIFIGTLPVFFLGILMIIVFSGWLGWFPSSGMLSQLNAGQFDGQEWWRPYTSRDFMMHYILPFSVIAIRYTNLPSLIMRTSVVEVSGQDFIYYHRVTGLSKLAQLRHIAKHASLPVITVYPISMTRALGGLVLLEVVFNWPGIGFTLVQSVLMRDFPVVQFVFFIVAAFVLLGNFGIDIIYGIIDPRVSVD
ncbi:ABC transporter permease subunit [Haloferax sp. MBLA0076]|uniref:ABC transporter permease subunit n=1 Tax=Haloferax litoreum TaxID=2666140 RepID=A0A6A8GLN9_9EURY|nr:MULTISPECIES: ABC transporter permease [Haloferax]KAB1190437.1 ABC transporter permease [Haloferax sp. CBA1148]MRX23412.1 ABC transporter permease subunit [Haloferax litoreum]